MKKILGFLLGVLIGYCIMIPVGHLKKEYNNLKKENTKLREELVDYKWQIDQVPYIVRYWCNGD